MKLIDIVKNIVVNEAVDLEVAKRYQKMIRKPEVEEKIDQVFNSLRQLDSYEGQSKRGERLYFDLVTPKGEPKPEDLALSKSNFNQIDDFFRKLPNFKYEMKFVDYLKDGTFNDSYGRPVKIGRALQNISGSYKKYFPNEDEDKVNNEKEFILHTLLKQFNEDPSRVTTRTQTKPKMVVVSRAKYDVIGMSADRGWASCMSLNAANGQTYVHCDVTEGTLIAYEIDADDKNITKPSARVTIKPFINTKDSNDIAYVTSGSVYGTSSVLVPFVKSVLFEPLLPVEFKTYKRNEKLYSDFTDDNKITTGKELTGEDLDQFKNENYQVITLLVGEYNKDLKDIESISNVNEELYGLTIRGLEKLKSINKVNTKWLNLEGVNMDELHITNSNFNILFITGQEFVPNTLVDENTFAESISYEDHKSPIIPNLSPKGLKQIFVKFNPDVEVESLPKRINHNLEGENFLLFLEKKLEGKVSIPENINYKIYWR
jgi:hypothetical protein